MSNRASVVFLLLIWTPVVRADFPCLCVYSLEAAVYHAKAVTAGTLGYMYEFDCKPSYENLTTDNPWTAIQFEHKIGYVQLTPDHLIQQCSGSILTADQVKETPSAASSTTHSPTKSPTSQSHSIPPHIPQPLTTQPLHSTIQSATQSPTTKTPITQPTTRIMPMTTQPSHSITTHLTTMTTSHETTKQSTIHTTKPTSHPPLTTIHTKTPLPTMHHINTHMQTTTHAPANACQHAVVTHASHHQGYVMSRGDSCFELVNDTKGWNVAENGCQQRGGHLTSIKDQAEENALLVFMYHHGIKHEVWIGLTDQHQEHHFTWSSGLPLDWDNWIPGKQNHFVNNHDDCVALFPDVQNVAHSNSVGTWDDVHCNINKPYICRFDSNPSVHLIG